MAIGLDAIGIDVEHEGADFAAGSGDRHGRKAWDATRLPGPAAVARTASAARPDPCRRCGVGHGAVVPRPLPWR
jgi:hypothetical protein